VRRKGDIRETGNISRQTDPLKRNPIAQAHGERGTTAHPPRSCWPSFRQWGDTYFGKKKATDLAPENREVTPSQWRKKGTRGGGTVKSWGEEEGPILVTLRPGGKEERPQPVIDAEKKRPVSIKTSI